MNNTPTLLEHFHQMLRRPGMFVGTQNLSPMYYFVKGLKQYLDEKNLSEEVDFYRQFEDYMISKYNLCRDKNWYEELGQKFQSDTILYIKFLDEFEKYFDGVEVLKKELAECEHTTSKITLYKKFKDNTKILVGEKPSLWALFQFVEGYSSCAYLYGKDTFYRCDEFENYVREKIGNLRTLNAVGLVAFKCDSDAEAFDVFFEWLAEYEKTIY